MLMFKRGCVVLLPVVVELACVAHLARHSPCENDKQAFLSEARRMPERDIHVF
jgi:hypothetical protein